MRAHKHKHIPSEHNTPLLSTCPPTCFWAWRMTKGSTQWRAVPWRGPCHRQDRERGRERYSTRPLSPSFHWDLISPPFISVFQKVSTYSGGHRSPSRNARTQHDRLQTVQLSTLSSCYHLGSYHIWVVKSYLESLCSVTDLISYTSSKIIGRLLLLIKDYEVCLCVCAFMHHIMCFACACVRAVHMWGVAVAYSAVLSSLKYTR